MDQPLRATYELISTNVAEAARALAIGQSIGNPYVRNQRETARLIETHAASVERIDGNRVVIAFPAVNFGSRDGIAFIMSVLLGGQLDIDLIESCRLVDVDFGAVIDNLPGPRYGLQRIREITGAKGRPLVGGIVKPKIGLMPAELAEVCREMAAGGVDFIKEDEVLGDPEWCPLSERVSAVVEALAGFKTIYAPCITGDGEQIVRRACMAKALGAGAVHFNIWSGLGAYLAVRKSVDIPIFFQKSGDKVWTTGANSMAFTVLCKIIRLIGCDFTHVGMWGGYMSDGEEELQARLFALQGNWCDRPKVVPSLSCGAHPGMVGAIRERFGDDIMISAGGAVHGHPMGTRAGAMAFRQAMEEHSLPPRELAAAIDEWGVLT